MKFIRGKEGEIINLQAVEIIDVVEVGAKLEVQAKLSEFSVELANFEHMEHARAYLDNLWKEITCLKTEENLRLEALEHFQA